MTPTDSEYERKAMAQLIAEVTCGIKGAEPEQADFDLADEVLALIEKRLSE